MYPFELSIVIVTMNRRDQLLIALRSCLDAKLPSKYEFVIVDNGSTDQSEEAVRELLTGHPLNYQNLGKNLGIGGGRNYGNSIAKGKYIYVMDDDAIISPKCRETFFMTSIQMFEQDERVEGITTEVFDTCLDRYRRSKRARCFSEKNPQIYMLHGNSHFLRNGEHRVDYCNTIKYGYEDLYASIRILNEQKKCVINRNAEITHMPLINKWIKGTEVWKKTTCLGNAGLYTVKYILYPRYMRPLLGIMFIARQIKHLGMDRFWLKEGYRVFKEQVQGQSEECIRCRVMLTILYQFGLGALL